jgi:hypothetical protein
MWRNDDQDTFFPFPAHHSASQTDALEIRFSEIMTVNINISEYPVCMKDFWDRKFRR